MDTKIHPSLSLVVVLSCGITIISSSIYLIICTFVLAFSDCTESINTNQLMPLLYRVYVLGDECEWSISLDYVTKTETVFILTVITLCTSVILLITAIFFIVVIKYKTDLVLIAGYIYVGLSFGSLVVDVTFATHFGLDYSAIVNEIDNEELLENNAFSVLLQFGIFLLVTISLKGFAIPLINIILIIIIVVYLENYKDTVKRSQHSIHTTGVLHAYEPQVNRPHMPWQSPSYSSNAPFVYSKEPSQNTSTTLYSNSPVTNPSSSNRPYTSWQSQNYNSNAPFAYPKEAPVATSTPNRTEAGWFRGWPEPDYSPQPKRLKSALKSNGH